MDYAKESLKLHYDWKGKIEVISTVKVEDKQDLSLAYTGIKNVLYDVAEAVRVAYQYIGEGAEIELSQIRFDRLAESIGTTGDALRSDLSYAIGGLLSDADAIKDSL